jgi:hypothetical protein
LDSNYLNTELQVRQKLIFDTFEAVRYFEMKLKLFRKEFENGNMCYLSSCELLHKDGSVCIPFPSVRVQEMVVVLPENFKMRFTAFVAMVHSGIKSAMLQKN